jgi:hypothetical protein
LFATICRHYIQAADQRVQFVWGLLCPNEPLLPPNTIRCLSRNGGQILSIISEMKGEMQWWDCDNVGDDLRLDDDNDRKLRSHEEMVECSRSMELIRGNVKAEASKTKMLVSISLKKKNSTLKKAVVLFKVLMDLVASHFRRNSEKRSES